MKTHQFIQQQELPAPIAEVWSFFSTPRNLERIMPPSMPFETISGADEPMYAGQLIVNKVSILPFVKTTWITEITQFERESYFIDEQRFGPYKLWHHRHSFQRLGDNHTIMTDQVDYALPFQPLGEIAHPLFVARQVKIIFEYRKKQLEEIFGIL